MIILAIVLMIYIWWCLHRWNAKRRAKAWKDWKRFVAYDGKYI